MLDFDLTRTFPPCYELVRGLIYCVKPTGGPAAFTERVTAFLQGYLATTPLSDAEVAGMVPLFTVVQTLDPHGLDTCRDAAQELLNFGQARFALLYWLDRYGSLLTDLASSRFPAGRGRDSGPHPRHVLPSRQSRSWVG